MCRARASSAEAVPCDNVVKSIACKRKITLVNIHSTRMLMAHGFLRRIFEVFDRFETPVDMVATSEVSVSLTIDNASTLDAILAELRQFAEVDDRAGPGHRLPGGREYPLHAGRGAARVQRARRHQHPHDLAGRVAAESQLRGGRGRPDAARWRRCTRSSSPSSTRRCSSATRRCMPEPRRLAIVGYGKMGRLIEQLAPEYGFAVALKLDEFNNANFEGITRGELPRHRCGHRFFDSRRGARATWKASPRWASTWWSAPPAGWSTLDAVQARGGEATASGWCGVRIFRSA